MNAIRLRVIAPVIAALLVVAAAQPVLAGSAWWAPTGQPSWQIQFSGRIDKSVAANIFDLDAVETAEAVVDKLHAKGRHVVCYINAGAWENWRPDAARYPSSVKGRALAGWPGEKWLDIRRLDVLAPILTDRIAACAAKGFDGVEFDNVDGYSNNTGFHLNAGDQLAFDRWLADAAHAEGLTVSA